MFSFLKEAFEINDDILYHATFGAYLDSIKKEGLVPGRNKNWDFSLSDKIDLSSDEDVAASYCEVAEDVVDEIYNSGIYIISIDISKLDKNKLQADSNVIDDVTFEYSGIIPTSAFISIKEYD